MICIKIEVILKVNLEINDPKLPQMLKWDQSLHEKMCQIIQNFQIYYFLFLITSSRFSTLHTRVTFKQNKAAISKGNIMISVS